jgi:hypothetical protein
MTDKQPEEKQVPLYELLEDIPEDFRIGFKDNDNWSAGVTWHPIGVTCHKAAAELRRLHEVNTELGEALKLLLDCPSGQYDTSDDYEIACDKANAALAKATGEQQ